MQPPYLVARNQAIIGESCQATDGGVDFETRQFPPAGYVPQPDCFVIGGRDEPPIWQQAENLRVAFEARGLSGGCHVP